MELSVYLPTVHSRQFILVAIFKEIVSSGVGACCQLEAPTPDSGGKIGVKGGIKSNKKWRGKKK